MSSSNKLHPIYVALDGHQYSRAVKLASSLPSDNILGQALFAHALLKSGQTGKALLVLRSLFQSQELDYEIQRLTNTTSSSGAVSTTTSSLSTTDSSSKRKKSKKGKSKVEEPVAAAVLPERDLLDQLETPLVLSEGWDEVKDATKPVITDETILDTLALTLKGMRLHATTFQLYSWAASAAPTAHNLSMAYLTGLRVIISHPNILGAMQLLALHLARLNQPHATMWVAQTALWQLQWTTNTSTDSDDVKMQKRLEMLPRLAESLAAKYDTAQGFLLYVSTLQEQSKYPELLDILLEKSLCEMITPQQVGELTADAQVHLEQWEQGQSTYATLLKDHPEQWAYWKGLLECAYHSGGWEEAVQIVQAQLDVLSLTPPPCRAHELIRCEVAAVRIRGLQQQQEETVVEESDATALQDAIVKYGTMFASRVSCAYSDLAPYLQLLVKARGRKLEALQSLLDWASELRRDSQGGVDHSYLRSYIFSVQVTYKVLSLLDNNGGVETWLPDWTELVQAWHASQNLGSAKEGDEVQKENQPGDELILLAVQNILFRDSSIANLLTAASLLEAALEYSPYNAYLKITAIHVYAALNAVHRAWELYQDLGIKHVQLDSCSYLILPSLIDGGLYNEAIAACNSILKLHASTASDTGEYAARAMEHGTLSKANEFLVFQRDRMTPSLSLLQAKGYIMDCAPLFFYNAPARKKQTLGEELGIVGGDSDLERVELMIQEAHNPFGAPNIITTTPSSTSNVSDNRDFSIMDHQILYRSDYATKDELANDSIRRGLLHGMLVRMTLCLDVTKGPKKGKVTKPSEILEKRCTSLLHVMDAIARFLETGTFEAGYKECMAAMLVLGRTFVFVSSGMPSPETEDTLASREQYAVQQLQSIVIPQIDWTVPTVCRFVPGILVPFVAILRMTANLFAIYGWGKRKHQTKASAGALANVAELMEALVGAMQQKMESLPGTDDECARRESDLVALVDTKQLEAIVVQTVCRRVCVAQQMTRPRVMPFLDEILLELSSFKDEASS